MLTVCLIARDEEPLLARCLRSASPYADETVVVDTGSADGTREVAREAGARVVEHAWQEDFSAARNAALCEARGRFVLVLDADEWVEAGPHPAVLRSLLARAGEEAYTVELVDRLDGGGSRHRNLPRLFRNRPGYRYRGRFAEEVDGVAAAGRCAAGDGARASGLVVAHEGHRLAQRARRGRAARNLQCLGRWLAEEPDNPFALYHAARERLCLRNGRAVPGSAVVQALALLEAAAEGLPPAPRTDAARLRAACLLASGRPAEALAAFEDADSTVASELLRAEAETALGARDAGLVERAVGRLEALFDREADSPDGWLEPPLSGAVARARAAEALAALGRGREAAAMAERALELPGGGAAPWLARAAVRRTEGRSLDALRDLLEGLRADPTDPWAWAATGEMLLERGSAAEAAEPLRHASRLAPGWHRADEALAAALLLAGREEDIYAHFACRDETLGPGAEAALLLAGAAGAARPPARVRPEVLGCVRRILERLACAGRPDLLERLALGLRAAPSSEAAP